MERVPVPLRCTIAGFVCCVVAMAAMPSMADLDLQVATSHANYLVDEPLFLMVAVTNSGVQEVRILRTFELGDGVLTLEVTPPGEPPHSLQHWVHLDATPESLADCVIRLVPGERYTAAVQITYDLFTRPGRMLLSRPGDYLIRACYSVPDGWPTGPISLRSNPLRLGVTEPQGVDKEAYQVLHNGARTRDRGLWNAYPEQGECYERILRDFPGSAYALYARFYLAQAQELNGEEKLRRIPEGMAAMKRAAALYFSVAEDTPDSPLGVCARMRAARAFAKVGGATQAQALLEEAFASAAATDEDRMVALSWMGHVETGLFYRESGLAPPGETQRTQLTLPLRRLAQALGLAVTWDPAAKTASISGRRVHSTLRPGESAILLNGKQRTGVRVAVKDGEVRVSPSVIAAFMAEQRGEGMAAALAHLLPRTQEVVKQ